MENNKIKLLQKLHNAKKQIKETPLKKAGKNTFSNYSYWLPEQVEELVFKACEQNKILTKFDLITENISANSDLSKVFGTLAIFDLETGESLEFKMPTSFPEIKATNLVQQIGGCMTYTERYLKMTAFGISENSLDFDSQEPKKQAGKETPQPKKELKELLLFDKSGNPLEVFARIKSKIEKGEKYTIEGLSIFYKISDEVRKQLLEHFNIK